MKTITFDENSEGGRTIMEIIRKMKQSARAGIHFIDEYIPGLAYTHEERISELIQAEEDHDPENSLLHEDFVKEMNSWF